MIRRPDLSNRTRRESAFTLIEVMVAALLLLVAMAGFVPFFLSGLEKSSVARYRSAATNIGREMLEEIRQLDYREIIENADQPTNPANLSNRLSKTREMRGTTFNIAYSVENSNSGGGQLKRVIVTVSWEGNPAGEPAVISSLIHQQFLGPRISSIELDGDISTDPLGTPFPLLPESLTANVYIATADFGLVYNKDVYLRLFFVDDAGAREPVGNPDSDYKIPKSYLKTSTNADGTLSSMWFEVPLDTRLIPDGYWELQGIVYNEYDQQGNLWRLRVRIENAAPDAPASVLALGDVDNQSIYVTWVPGSERDRATWVLERQKSTDGGLTYSGSGPTVTLLGTASAYDDLGNAAGEIDPWGGAGITNYYQYRLWAIDRAGNEGEKGYAEEQLPSTDPVTTTTAGSTTTTTVASASYSVTILNQTPKAYDITITDSSSAAVFTGRLAKNGGTNVATGLAPGYYYIFAVEVVNTTPRTLNSTFSLPDQAGTIVLTIVR